MLRITVLTLLLLVSNTCSQENRAGVRPKEGDKDTTGQARIVGGLPASPTRYPYAASLTLLDKVLCGASLIAPDIVLTAAHCRNTATGIEVGRYDRSVAFASYESFAIEQEFPHPSFARSNGMDFDQMLVKLSQSSEVTPVRINGVDSVPSNGQEVTVIGHGLTDGGDQSSGSSVLREVSIFTISNQECSDAKSPQFSLDTYQGLITDDMLCAIEDGQDACQGDSGGGLFLLGADATQDVQVGVVSWGYGCAIPGFPGVYSRLSADFEWIKSVVCEQSSDPPDYFQCSGSVNPPPPPPPTTSPTSLVVPEGSVPVTINVQMDLFPEDIGFKLERLGFNAVTVFRRSAGVFNTPFEFVALSLFLEENELYSFTIFDIRGDGMCCTYGNGIYELYVGENKVISSTGAFGTGREHVFLASEVDSSAATLSPQPSPDSDLFLTLVITFDAYPSEIGWVLRRVDGGASNAKSVNTLVAFQPPRLYSSDLANKEKTQVIDIPSGGDYTFDLTDSYGDGLCCLNGEGGYVLYNGAVENGKIVAQGNASGTGRERTTFFIVDGKVAPTAAPAPIAPTISPAPTNLMMPVTIQILPDRYPRDIGWSIEDESGNVVADKPTGSYDENTAETLIETQVMLETSTVFTFTIFDEFEDGICCLQGLGAYQIMNSNGVLATGGSFKGSESTRFSTEGTYPVTVSLSLDDNPTQVGWSFRRLDILNGWARVSRKYRGTYETPNAVQTHSFDVAENGLYAFLIEDSGKDGFGDLEIAHGDNQAKGYSPAAAGVTWVMFFAGSIPSPQKERKLTLELTFDDYPNEIQWYLVSSNEDPATSVQRTFYNQQSVVAFGPETPYSQSLFGRTIVQPITVEDIPLGSTRSFTFVIQDVALDGLCCKYGNGSWRLLDGTGDNNNQLLAGKLEGIEREIRSFVLTAEGGKEVPGPNIEVQQGAKSGGSILRLSVACLVGLVSFTFFL